MRRPLLLFCKIMWSASVDDLRRLRRLKPHSVARQWWKRPWGVVLAAIGVIVIACAAIFWWYAYQLTPVNKDDTSKKVVTVVSGSTPQQIAETLHDAGVIRNQTAFLWRARIEGVENTLQAGAYRLSPSESTPEIIEHVASGRVDTFSITFLPGATVRDNKEVFLASGYSQAEIDTAFAKQYTSPLFQGKPASADLEGYIYGETYQFSTETSVEAILEHTFEEFYGVVTKNNLVARFKAHNLSLYEGITLASIIQREATPEGTDMPQIAQVFYSRLAKDMPLGSDVTYQYIADKMGVERDTNLDSPYNTRRFQGLPPGPIASPGKKALLAVALPAKGDYLYFLNGDDDVTYFARSFEEHEANIVNHCQKKCQIL